jgi:hypothetical protein
METKPAEVASYDGDIIPTRRRLEWNTYLVLAAMLIGSWLTGNLKVILGTILGGVLGLINYRWLSASLSVIIPAAAESNRVPRWTASKFILRYFVIGASIVLALWSGWFNLGAIMISLCAFAGAVMIEAGYQIYRMIVHCEESTK